MGDPRTGAHISLSALCLVSCPPGHCVTELWMCQEKATPDLLRCVSESLDNQVTLVSVYAV